MNQLPETLKEKARAAYQTGSLEAIEAVVLEALLKQPPEKAKPIPFGYPHDELDYADNAKGWATC